jgi:hypothetical protein
LPKSPPADLTSKRAGPSTTRSFGEGPPNPPSLVRQTDRSFFHCVLFAGQSKPPGAKAVGMKCYSVLLVVIIAVLVAPPMFAEEKPSLPPNATILNILQGNTGKTVELRMSCGEKIGGKVEQVNESLVLLSHLTGAEYFDGFINVKDISAVVVRVGGR